MNIKLYYLNKYTKEDKLNIFDTEISNIYSNAYSFEYNPNRREYCFKDLIDCDILYIAYVKDIPIAFLILKYKEKVLDKYNAIYIVETCTLKEYQNKGINKRLREYIIKDLKPNIIYGEVNNPISVKSRLNITNKHRYTTYWMEEKISKGNDIINIKEITKECIKVFNPKVLDRHERGIVPYLVWDTAIPDENMNIFKEYNILFNRLKDYSNNTYKSCLGVLISFKEN